MIRDHFILFALLFGDITSRDGIRFYDPITDRYVRAELDRYVFSGTRAKITEYAWVHDDEAQGWVFRRVECREFRQ